VTLLDTLLNGRGLFGKREDTEIRACAAMALGRVGSDAAQASLRKATSDKEVLVRNAVNRGLRGGPV
jgi:HEAT repeat protein